MGSGAGGARFGSWRRDGAGLDRGQDGVRLDRGEVVGDPVHHDVRGRPEALRIHVQDAVDLLGLEDRGGRRNVGIAHPKSTGGAAAQIDVPTLVRIWNLRAHEDQRRDREDRQDHEEQDGQDQAGRHRALVALRRDDRRAGERSWRPCLVGLRMVVTSRTSSHRMAIAPRPDTGRRQQGEGLSGSPRAAHRMTAWFRTACARRPPCRPGG